MAAMWSHVKFETCGSVSNVPTSYFKDVFEKTLNPEELQVGSVYSVFWTPAGEKISPENFTSTGNDLIDVDSLPVKEKNRLVKENKNKPLAGYYDAVLVDLRSAEDSIVTVSSEMTSSTKRTVIPTHKVLLANQQKAKRETTSKIPDMRSRSKAQKLATEEASRANILSFLSSTSAGQALDLLPRAKSSDLSTNVTKIKPAASEALPVGKASEKNKKVAAEEAYRSHLLSRLGSRGLGNKVSQVQTRNDSDSTDEQEGDKEQTKEIEEDSAEYWKKKFEEAKKQSDKVLAKTGEKSKKEVKKHKHTKTVTKGPQPALGKLKRTSNETSDSEKRKFSSGGKGASKASHDGKADKLSEKESSDSSNEEDDDDMDKDTKESAKESAEDSDDESKMAISYIKKKKIKPGEDGDSLFVFNEAAKLWKPKVLAIRSPTGLAASRLKTAPYPKLTPDKKKTIEGALKRRIKGENPPVSKQDRGKRVSRLNYLLSQKIGSVRRSLRDKGVVIPSAEMVNQVREEDPAADGTAAYEEAGPAEP